MIVGHSLIFRQLLGSHLHPDLVARSPTLARGLSEGKLGYCNVACCDLDFDSGELIQHGPLFTVFHFSVNEELRCLAGTRVIVDVTVLKAQLVENGYVLAPGGASAAAAQEALV